MANVGWRTRISFLLAGAIFVLCQMIVSGSRNAGSEASFNLAGDRSFQGGAMRAGPASRAETDGRAIEAD